jgi:hypothetical protein
MNSRENGKHCLSCCKTVIDFTGWDSAEIANYLRTNSQQNVCGRVMRHQLESQGTIDKTSLLHNVMSSNIGGWKKFAAIVVIIFALQATSCTRNASIGKVVSNDQMQTQDLIMGEIALPDTICQPKDTAAHVLNGNIVIDSLPEKIK